MRVACLDRGVASPWDMLGRGQAVQSGGKVVQQHKLTPEPGEDEMHCAPLHGGRSRGQHLDAQRPPVCTLGLRSSCLRECVYLYVKCDTPHLHPNVTCLQRRPLKSGDPASPINPAVVVCIARQFSASLLASFMRIPEFFFITPILMQPTCMILL